MKHEKYLLVMDTYAHSVKNTFYAAQFPTTEKAIESVCGLLARREITFSYDGPETVKIFIAVIYKRVAGGRYLRVAYFDREWCWIRPEAVEAQDPYSWKTEGLHTFEDLKKDADSRK